MKPDGVVTAALEPMEALESNPGNEAVGQEPDQAASPMGEEMPQPPVGEAGQVKPQPEQAKETPPAKTSKTVSGDSKAKTTNRATPKTKSTTTSQTKTTAGSRPNTTQSRLSNGVSKPQTNGVAKKPAPSLDKKSTPTLAPSKKPTGTSSTLAPKSKVGEKKPAGASSATSGVKSTTGPTAAKKTPSATANGVKTSTTAPAAKKPPALKSATPTKPSSTASPKPDKIPVSKTTRPTTAASSRPATGSTRQPSATTTKSSSATAKPATPKTPSTKPPASKPTSSTPSGGKPPALQSSKSSTPLKKDVTKPTTPAAKKPANSPLTRPSSTTKPVKSETPKSASKSDVATKKLTTTKVAETKTPNRSKTQDGKPTPSKDASKAPGSKAKPSSPKKTVGSSTPMPVKRGPKAAALGEPAKETVAAVAATAAIATAATAAAFAGPEEPELPATTPEAVQEKTSEPTAEPVPAPVLEPTPEPIREPTPELIREPTPEPMRELTPEPIRVPTPEPMRELTPEPIREPTPEPLREPTPEPLREPTPEPMREPTPEPMREPTPVREPTPEPLREPTPEPLREPTPEPVREPTPEPVREPSPYQLGEADLGAESVHELPYSDQLSAQLDQFKFEESANDSVTSLGTTVMSPPCSPPGPVSPVREPQNAYSLQDMHLQSDPWDQNQHLASSDAAPQSTVNTMNFQEKEDKEYFAYDTREEEKEEEDEEEEEEEEEEEKNLLMSPPTAPPAQASPTMAQPHLLGTLPMDDDTFRDLTSPHEKEVAVEKADEEINDDDEEEDEEEEYEDEEQRRLGHQPSSMITEMSMSQPSEEFQVCSPAFGSSAGWHGDDLLSGMDSEDVSSCTSSRQQGVSDLSSTLHTAILEGTQSSDALVDSSLRGSEGDGNLMGSPNVETLANEEEDEEDEEDERVDEMDLSSERIEEHHKVFQQQERDEEDDDDVEMHSEGVTESCENVDEDDFNEEEHLDNLNRSAPPSAVPPACSWSETNPFHDTWGQPASLLAMSSPSPVSDHGAAESETPTQSPAQTCLDSSAPSFASQSEQDPLHHQSAHEDMEDDLLAASAVGMSHSSGPGLAAHSSSETSTPEEPCDYDSSSGVESRSDKQQTPVPASVHADMDQDLGIHLEKGDGEEEEAETLPADEVLGTGPPTAPASAPSSPSTSGDEASDTEGEMQINDPDAPMMMDESAGFESPTPTCNLPCLDEDEEAAPAGDGEEDGGGATPQSANSVASYGFDCSMSNSNAHSMAESCGKSPGIFSLENEEQLPEEAKDPSLIKELTLPAAAAAQAEDLLGRPVDLMPLGLPGGIPPALDEHHYMLGGKVAVDHLGELDPSESSHHFGAQDSEDTDDSQPPYYSTICDKTDSFLAGDEKSEAVDGDQKLQVQSQEDNQNQNHSTAVPIANGHYLALVPGNRRPIDPTLAAHFVKIAPLPPPPSPLIETGTDGCAGGEQLRRLEQHQQKLREMQHRQDQERQKKQWLEDERLRLEQQKHLEMQREDLLQLQLQQQEHQQRRQVLQWQLELEQQYRMQQKQQQQQLRRSPTGAALSPSSGLCTIYEAMETSDEEDEARGEQNWDRRVVGAARAPSSEGVHAQLHPVPPQDLEWNRKVDMVQQLINQTLMLSGDGGCPPLLLLPVGTGGTLSPLESSMWPNMPPHFSPPVATVTSVSSYSPDSRGSSPPGDWTVVEVETQH